MDARRASRRRGQRAAARRAGPQPRPAGWSAAGSSTRPNGNATADTTGTNPGTLSGAARIGGGFPGAQYTNPGSLRFDGDNDFVALGTRNLPANNRPQTVAFWFNVAAMPANPQICVSLTDGRRAARG